MSPEALARLRKMVTEAFDGSPVAEQMLSNGPVAEMMTDLRALLDAHDTARADGVATERARVVAWLRAADSETLVWFAAQRIEQGWHDKERGDHDKEGM